jgi:hypothetical protein
VGNKKRPLETSLQRAFKHTDLWKFIPEVCVFLITWCGPDGQHLQDYNPIFVIPPGLDLEEAHAMIKRLQNAKENTSETSV